MLKRSVNTTAWQGGVVLWLALWLVIFAPLYCYRHGLLIFHSVSGHEDHGAHFEDYVCGEGTTPNPHAHAESTHHSTASHTLLISSAMILLPHATHVVTRNATLVTRLFLHDTLPQHIYLPKLKTPPRLVA